MAYGIPGQLGILGGSLTGPICTDGTYLYFEIREGVPGPHHLYKFSPITKTVVASVVTPETNNCSGGIATDGTSILLANGDGIRRYLCSDLSNQGMVVVNNLVGMVNAEAGGEAFFDGTYFWFGGYSQPNQINRITPGTWALAQFGNTANHGAGVGHICAIGNDLLLFGYNQNGAIRVTKAGAVVWSNLTANASTDGAAYDSVRGEVWLANGVNETVVLRGSDGAWIDRHGAVVATEALARIGTGTDGDSLMSSTSGVGIAGDSVIIGGQPTNPGATQRRGTAPPRYSGGYWWSAGSAYPAIPRPLKYFCVLGTTVYASPSANAAWGWAGIVWMDVSAVVPSLTDVSPGAGPHISLTFDNPVGVVGPTLGPAAAGISVTSVAQLDSTHIDLNLVAAGQSPAAPIGAATNDTGPEAPSGGAVTSDPTPAVPVAGAFRRPT
jgi:hypothetical protein